MFGFPIFTLSLRGMKMGFPKKERLRNSKQIEKLFAEGKSVAIYPIKLFYLKIDTLQTPSVQSAFAVPKRNFKKAVERNRIRRQLREAYRQSKMYGSNNLKNSYSFLFLYIGKQPSDFYTLIKAMKTIMQEIYKQ
jgi:ribonuclease P protein component